MRCPKNMRNGPCGGAQDAMCEVYPERKCAWCLIFYRARFLRRDFLLEDIQDPVDWRLEDTASWLNALTGRIKMPLLFPKRKQQTDT